MATLAANLKRTYEFNEDALISDVPVVAAGIIYEGAAVGEDISTGLARPLEDGDTFLGFAVAKADNSAGSAGDVYVRVRQQGIVKLAVTGVAAAADLGNPVYATDDNTFSDTDSGSDTQIGKVTRWVSGTTCMVRFEATAIRSI